MEPIKWPEVTISGITYSLKMGPTASFVADELRVDFQKFFSGLQTQNVGTFSDFIKIFSAMVAHHWAGRPNQVAPTPTEWMAKLEVLPDAESRAKCKEICQAVGATLRLKMEETAALRLQEPAPGQERPLGTTLN